MRRFAEHTTVAVDRSVAEIKSTIQRYGATHFAFIETPDSSCVEFICNDRRIRFILPLPSASDKRFTQTPGRGKQRSADQAYVAWEQACRQRWRALNLAIKAKLEAVTSGISEFESEFLAFIVDPVSGHTVGEIIRPKLQSIYANGTGQLLLTSEAKKK